MTPAAPGSAPCTTPLTRESSCLNWALILATSASAFMRAMMSCTFAFFAGLLASLAGRPCASAHARSLAYEVPGAGGSSEEATCLLCAMRDSADRLAACLAWARPSACFFIHRSMVLGSASFFSDASLMALSFLLRCSLCVPLAETFCFSWMSFSPSLMALALSFSSLAFFALASSALVACAAALASPSRPRAAPFLPSACLGAAFLSSLVVLSEVRGLLLSLSVWWSRSCLIASMRSR
mmetsp:Transcript_29003/g.67821  ORF Transcript_29003/g.67821 Transcript_29003/m.67821 type:complete len:239 (-) Transcript_29003:375-1091(-)